MATSSPSPRYRAATCQPKSPSKSASATSLTMGAETRKEKVTPSGTPADRKPMKSGTASRSRMG